VSQEGGLDDEQFAAPQFSKIDMLHI
jgi:hypothetical protein